MRLLILKLGATGDVVRTTPLLRRFTGPVTWVTAAKNLAMLEGIREDLRGVSWEQRQTIAGDEYDLLINLEDTADVGEFARLVKCKQVFGALLDNDNRLTYTPDSRRWFDLSLISSFGKEEADRRKLLNRHTYQELIFEGLGQRFSGEKYVMP